MDLIRLIYPIVLGVFAAYLLFKLWNNLDSGASICPEDYWDTEDIDA